MTQYGSSTQGKAGERFIFNPSKRLPITFTDRALLECAENLFSCEDLFCLVLFTQKKGCFGYKYGMRIERESAPNTVQPFVLYEISEISPSSKSRFVGVSPTSILTLSGTEVDYMDNQLNPGFIFNNPNVSGTCGCSTSFRTHGQADYSPGKDTVLKSDQCSSCTD